MISYIKGILEDMSPGMVVVDNHGIGYQMMVPMRGESFPKIGQEIKIYTHMHVREDDVSLFGFLSKEEKEAIKAEIKAGLEGLAGQIPGLIDVHVNINGLESSTADVMLDTTFESVDALKAYAVNPKHVAVADGKVRPYTAIRSCLDYEV